MRDLADDHDVLRRDYFPGLDVDRFCDADRDRILDDIDADLAAAAVVVPALPSSSRRAVARNDGWSSTMMIVCVIRRPSHAHRGRCETRARYG